ncbi:hypothetical protein DTO027I6_7824 [Penicillium roqueforti]|nr:hypothetical protein CBS147337_765 [Penicillium roqueforti]KAI2686438.1 hypothetical protein CBS147355_1925 [Penicillium roqueforti]KAI2691513.1 hypothetical protein LCP963914a_1714 [Penicillium roqueforti]KAI3172297.1 hypothetical protein CBS147317_1726 [Penicillium roqueforti]KAI3194417.1 hypothetical protein DTO027I6_7824 [Penicillium roqueforti]
MSPHFAYQLQFKSEKVEKAIRSKAEIRQFLIALYGGRTQEGERLLSEEELDFYTDEFARNGLHGPLNYYRTGDLDYDDELPILERGVQIPTLFIQALRDEALPPYLGKSMGQQVPRLTLEQVDTSHWALWEKPEEVNEIIRSWLNQQYFADGRSGKL